MYLCIMYLHNLVRQYTTLSLHTVHLHCALYTLNTTSTLHTVYRQFTKHYLYTLYIYTVHVDCTYCTQHYLVRQYTALTLHTVHLRCTHGLYTLYTTLSGHIVHNINSAQQYTTLPVDYITLTDSRQKKLRMTQFVCISTLSSILSQLCLF